MDEKKDTRRKTCLVARKSQPCGSLATQVEVEEVGRYMPKSPDTSSHALRRYSLRQCHRPCPCLLLAASMPLASVSTSLPLRCMCKLFFFFSFIFFANNLPLLSAERHYFNHPSFLYPLVPVPMPRQCPWPALAVCIFLFTLFC